MPHPQHFNLTERCACGAEFTIDTVDDPLVDLAARCVERWRRNHRHDDPAVVELDKLERLPFDHYADDLRDELKRLARIWPAATVAEAAAALAAVVAEHGARRPDARLNIERKRIADRKAGQ